MAAENPAFCISADSHSAALFRQAVASLLPRGVGGLTGAQGGIVNSTDLVVSAGSGNSVNVAAGQVWIPGNQNASQSLYFGYNDATVNLAITPNGSNPMYYIICVGVNDAQYTGNPADVSTANSWAIYAHAGTPAGSPTVPATPANSILLATVLVPTSASSSSSYTITDKRPTIGTPVARVNATSQTVVASGTVVAIVNAATTFLRGGMTQSSAGACGVTVPVPGLYSVECQVGYQASGSGVTAGGEYQAVLYKNGTQINSNAVRVNATDNPSPSITDMIQCAAGDTITLQAYQGSGSSQGCTSTAITTQPQTYLIVELASI